VFRGARVLSRDALFLCAMTVRTLRHKVGVGMALLTALLSSWLAGCRTREQPKPVVIAPGYPELAGGPILGASYELARILPQGDAPIYFVPSRREFVVAGLGYVYRYGEAGELRDLHERGSESTQRIHEVGLNDRMYCTSDVAVLPQWLAADSADEAVDDVQAWFDGADDFEVVLDATTQLAYALVRRGDSAQQRVSRAIYAWLIAHNELLEKQAPLFRDSTVLLHCRRAMHLKALPWRTKDTESPLQVEKYQRVSEPEVERSWFDTHFSFGHADHWRPPHHGLADVRLRHDNDELRFRVRMGEDPSATFGEKLISSVRRVELPESLRRPDSAELVLRADDGGLYILRKQGHEADAAARERYFATRPMSFVLRGLKPMLGVWSGLRFFNGRVEDFADTELAAAVPAQPRSLPSELHFYWDAPKLGEYETWEVATADGSVEGRAGLSIALVFDRQALFTAIAHFPAEAALEYRIDATHYKQGVWLSVTLSDGQKTVPLPKTRMGSHDRRMSAGSSGTNSYVSAQHFQHLLQQASARSDPRATEELLSHLADMPAHALKLDAEDHAHGLERFVNLEKHAGHDDVVRAAFALFLKKIQPHLEPNTRVAQKLAVNVLAVSGLDKTLYEQVWSQLLHGDEQAAKLSEPKLLFNLACYASRVGNKPGMLYFAERALQLGKQPADFTRDRDFDPYRDDADLAALLQRYRGAAD
jgi:hypothetical protein